MFMDEQIAQALAITPSSPTRDRTVDITTTGAKTGQARRIEIWFYRVDGEIYLTGTPSARSWYANLLVNPDFTFHLKHEVKADLAAKAEPVLDVAERTRILGVIVSEIDALLSQQSAPLDVWVAGAPLMHVTFA